MSATVLLKDIVDALEMQFDEAPSFLDLDSGQVETVSMELLRAAEEPDDEEPWMPDWQRREWEVVQRIVSTDRFVRLPTKFDVNEWSIMEDFAHSVASENIRADLLNAIHGRGAFRFFKETIRRHGMEPAWFKFRTEALRQIAVDWCEEHQIRWQ